MKDSSKQVIDPAPRGASAKRPRKRTAPLKPSGEQIRKITRMVVEMNRETLEELARH